MKQQLWAKRKPLSLSYLRKLGFDKSEYDRSNHAHIVGCSQCVAVFINGIPCHETGCPNEGRKE